MQPCLRHCALTLPPSLETWVLGSWSAGVSSMRVRCGFFSFSTSSSSFSRSSKEVQEEEFGGEGEEEEDEDLEIPSNSS